MVPGRLRQTAVTTRGYHARVVCICHSCDSDSTCLASSGTSALGKDDRALPFAPLLPLLGHCRNCQRTAGAEQLHKDMFPFSNPRVFPGDAAAYTTISGYEGLKVRSIDMP